VNAGHSLRTGIARSQPSRTQAPLGDSWQPGPQEKVEAVLGVPSTAVNVIRQAPI
jgi:hypothetical protein